MDRAYVYLRPTEGLAGAISKKAKGPRKKSIPKYYHLTDEQAKDVIRSHRNGVSFKELVKTTGYSNTCIRNLCTGITRRHLLIEVEMEAKPMMGEKK